MEVTFDSIFLDIEDFLRSKLSSSLLALFILLNISTIKA